MRFFSTLRCHLRRASQPQRFRPHIPHFDHFETRIVPNQQTLFWRPAVPANAQGTVYDWDNNNNWCLNRNGPGGQVPNPPDASDNVNFDGNSDVGRFMPCTVEGPNDICASLTITNAPKALIIKTALTVEGGGSMDSGEIDPNGPLVFTGIRGGSFNWSDGKILGSPAAGKISVANLFEIGGRAASLQVPLQIQAFGRVAFDTRPGPFTFKSAGNSGVQIQQGGTLLFTQAQGDILSDSGEKLEPLTIQNQGTIVFNSSATITCQLPIVNSAASAALKVLGGGVLRLSKGGVNSGNYSLYQIDGTTTVFSGSVLSCDQNLLMNTGTFETQNAGGAGLIGNLKVLDGDVWVDVLKNT
jgi:hypothetical protein